MAQTGSVDAGVPAWRQWAAIGAGMLAAWCWVLVTLSVAPDLLGGEATPAIYAGFIVVLYGPMLAIALLAGWIGRTPVLRSGRSRRAWSIAGLAIGAGGLCAALAMSWLNGAIVRGGLATGFGGLVLMGMCLTLFQSAMEEVLFRGWLQPVMSQRLGQVAGVAASSLLFMAFHLIGGSRHPLSLLVITLAGVLFGLLALRSGGLLAPVLAHAGWNASESWIFGMVPNPGNELLGSILDIDLVGNPWWGGSDEGMNASVGAALVLLAAALPLLFGWSAGGERTAAPVPVRGT